MVRIFRWAVLLTMAALASAPFGLAQQSAREARKSGEHLQKEAMKRAKRAQKEARRREKEVRKRLKERDSDRTAETRRLIKERKREQKREAASRPTTKSPFEVDDKTGKGSGEKGEKPEIHAKQRGIDSSTESSGSSPPEQ